MPGSESWHKFYLLLYQITTMINGENKEASQNSEGQANTAEEMDRNEGQTLNGTIGGTGSELDEAGKRIKEERDGGEQSGSADKKS